VDFGVPERLVADLDHATNFAELVRAPEDGRLKLHVIRAVLRARREHESLFTSGGYEPLHVSGQRAPHVLAFLRREQEAAAITVVPRFTRALGGEHRPPVGEEVWGDTAVELPPELARCEWTCVVGGHSARADGTGVPVARLLEEFPVAVAVRR
jgi:(1->4)-alpha-D-glucan 1-alpha-D-glucosylmutase